MSTKNFTDNYYSLKCKSLYVVVKVKFYEVIIIN